MQLSDEMLWGVIGIAAAVLVVVIVISLIVHGRRKREREALRARYGSEYDRTVEATGGKRAAATDLRAREQEREALRLRPPRDDERDDLRVRMAALQYRFVDNPGEVLLETQRVALDALRIRGYPVANEREQALRSLSVDHPQESVTIRTLLEGSYGTDIATLHQLFVDTRRALSSVMGLSYSVGDAAHALSEAAATERPATEVKIPGTGDAPATERPAPQGTEPLDPQETERLHTPEPPPEPEGAPPEPVDEPMVPPSTEERLEDR